MFEFEKLTVYQKAKSFHKAILKMLLENEGINRMTRDQLSRASLSVVLNIAEGTSRFTNPSKKNYYVISRGSAFECVAALDILKDTEIISELEYDQLYGRADELSRMLFKMIRNLELESGG